MENEAIRKQIKLYEIKKNVSNLYASMHRPVTGYGKTEYFIIPFLLASGN